MKDNKSPKGIGGWLIVFNIWLAFQLITSIIAIPFLISTYDKTLDILPILLTSLYLPLIILIIFLEVKLKKEFVYASILVLIFALIIKIVIDIAYWTTGGSISTGIVTFIWIMYLASSKRVKNTFVK